MHASDVAGHSVPARFEPYDMGVIYAFIDGQWLECIADNYRGKPRIHGNISHSAPLFQNFASYSLERDHTSGFRGSFLPFSG
jgi:hypothetical protein